ncbi:hypothetical protein Ancab_022622 [Ancistrocladus abbreviatus]
MGDDVDELPYRSDHDSMPDDIAAGYFQFQPRTLGSLFSSAISSRKQNFLPINFQYTMLPGVNRLQGGAYTFPSSTTTSKEMASLGSACDEADAGLASNDSLSEKDLMSEDRCEVLDD